MEVAVAAIALITVFCGRSVCCDPSPKLKFKAGQSREMDLMMNEYMEYMAMEDRLQQDQYQQLKQLYRR